MTINYQALMARQFAPSTRHYSRAESAHFARGFGAGMDAAQADYDEPWLNPDAPKALPMAAVALADGEFWQQDPATGIVWQKIVHSAESIRMHGPLPPEGSVVATQRIKDIFDRGADRGAVMVQEQNLSDAQGNLLVSIEVTTVLKGNGGFGGQPPTSPRPEPLPNRPPDGVLDLCTPTAEDTAFKLTVDLDVAGADTEGVKRSMIRGVGCFGLAGRAALKLACANQPDRLQAFGVRYAGPMFTGETMRIALWEVGSGLAVFRMDAVERNQPVLSHGFIEYSYPT
ncbi:MAG TPA: hypothetical protein ENI17_08085 [Pseudomonas xinjiangensis]|uniref:FAS1-like dehydratase domain-containing protein n=2 Tax=root TaxID=1 RepID=A0A7V1FQR7_9GAMM|nr:hypothetical protein [Halopseudomonas xinjiangensis]HEC47573.1 hypothetical protein [Halopseudomonas xinjiangensis]